MTIQTQTEWIDRGYTRVINLPSALYTSPRTTFFTNSASLYAQYDALVSAYPDYISRSSLGQDAIGNHIYQYIFAPPTARITAPAPGSGWTTPDVLPPKVILMSGLHGSERTSQLGTLIFATNLASQWMRSMRYSRLRWGARIVIIPAAVPSAVNAGTRPNHNGVDINRNAAFRWGEAGETEPGGDYYMGPSAASETETQILQNLPTTHPDAVAVIDHHNHAEEQAIWFGTGSTAALEVAKESAWQLGSYVHRELSGPNTDPGAAFVWLTKTLPGNVVGYISETGGIDAAYAEGPSVPNDFIDNTSDIPNRRLSESVALTLVDAFVQRELRRRQQS